MRASEKNNGFLVVDQDEFYAKTNVTEWGKIFLSPLPATLVAHKWFQHSITLWKATLTSILWWWFLFFFFLSGMPVNFLLESVLGNLIVRGSCWAAAKSLCDLSNNLLSALQCMKLMWHFLTVLLEIRFFLWWFLVYKISFLI